MGIFDAFKKKQSPPPVPPREQPATAPQDPRLMTKADVEMVLVKISIDNIEVLEVKIYRDGTFVRGGMAALPHVQVSTLSQMDHAQSNWRAFMETVPDELLTINGRHVASEIKRPFSYTVVFYGDSANGQTGEYADWQRVQGIGIEGNLEGPYHPLHGLLEKVALSAMRITNSYYLDVVVLSCWDLKERNLNQGMVSMGKDANKEQTWNDYLMHLAGGPFASEISSYTQGKVYEDKATARKCKLEIKFDGANGRYDFVPIP